MNPYTDISKEIDAITKQIEINPENQELYWNRAELHLKNKDIKNYFIDLYKLIEINPQSELGIETNKFLIELYSYQLKTNPANSNTLTYRADSYKNIGKISEALADYNNAIKIDPENKDNYFGLGDCYFGKGDFKNAYHNYEIAFDQEKFVEIDDDFADRLERIADYFISIEQYDKAINILRNIERRNYDEFVFNYLQDKITEIEKIKAKKEERDKIIRSQAHNIKNILRSVINPLEILKRKTQDSHIEEALKGTAIIREMVNAISLSYSGAPDDFFFDARNNKNGARLSELIIIALEASVSNIIKESEFFQSFWEQYFPDDESYHIALNEFDKIQEIDRDKRLDSLIKFIEKYLFDLKIEFGQSARFIIGHTKSSNIKILSLFNELIFNAVKYTSFVEKNNRLVHILFSSNKNSITLRIENSSMHDIEAKTTGTGNLIIDNLLEVMGGKLLKHNFENDLHKIEIEFPNYWEGENSHGKNSVRGGRTKID